MKRIFKICLSTFVVLGLASCSGASSKYPATGDMKKDATNFVTEMLKDSVDADKVQEMAASYESYYKGKGKYEEFEAEVKTVTGEIIKQQLDDAFNESLKKDDTKDAKE